jgi:hypothetical protein
MRFWKYILLTALLPLACIQGHGQNVLPGITIRKFNDRVIISWLNEYSESLSNISIQRSYDSNRHFITIGSVLNPMNRENGFSDYQPPYDRMYYRVLITFEGGKYTYSESMRPEPDTEIGPAYTIHYRWQYVPPPVEEIPLQTDTFTSIKTNPIKDIPTAAIPVTPPAPPPVATPPPLPVKPIVPEIPKEHTKEATYPSQRIYTSKDNSIILDLPDASNKRYTVKFFDETDKEIINLSKIQEDFLILEKVNFIHSGWFYFELKEGNNLIEKNKIFIPKDVKPGENGRNGKN